VPALQFRQVEAPEAFWYLPAAQSVHEVACCPSETDPAAQLEHTPASLKKPALHMMKVQELEPAAVDSVPAAQAVHETAAAAE